MTWPDQKAPTPMEFYQLRRGQRSRDDPSGERTPTDRKDHGQVATAQPEQASTARARLAVCRDCAQHGDGAGDGCAGCWCRLLTSADGRPDRRAYKAVLRGEQDCPAER